jgi:hypothetical protein
LALKESDEQPACSVTRDGENARADSFADRPTHFSGDYSFLVTVHPSPGNPGEGRGVRAEHSVADCIALTPNPSPGVPGEGGERLPFLFGPSKVGAGIRLQNDAAASVLRALRMTLQKAKCRLPQWSNARFSREILLFFPQCFRLGG